MRKFTDARQVNTQDELWVLEHPPVYTLGQAGNREHVLNPGLIPVIESDRGGQVTYHGPGQVIVYTLIDLRRADYGIRGLVTRIEDAVIDCLATYSIVAQSKRDAPGVYVQEKKIAALGLRVRRGCSYHGLSLNIDADLTPFAGINPCGSVGLEVTSTQQLGVNVAKRMIVDSLLQALQRQLQSLT